MEEEGEGHGERDSLKVPLWRVDEKHVMGLMRSMGLGSDTIRNIAQHCR